MPDEQEPVRYHLVDGEPPWGPQCPECRMMTLTQEMDGNRVTAATCDSCGAQWQATDG